MNSYAKDYTKLYLLQDKFLAWWQSLGLPFYLTGGTALGRFYLNHRFSDDLDFFINASSEYPVYIAELRKSIGKEFTVNTDQSLFSDDFTRIFIAESNTYLKIDFVNDIGYYVGKPATYAFGKIDRPLNILSNKLTAVIARDEPKDIFDIIQLSLNYSFNWLDIFSHAKQKAVLNEIDIDQRLNSFPASLLRNADWLLYPVDVHATSAILKQISDDFLLGASNSLGLNKMPIEIAEPVSQYFSNRLI